MSSQTLFLTSDMTVNIDGVEFKVSDLKDHVIDSRMYRKRLQKLMETSK